MWLQIRQEGTSQWLKLQQLLPELRGGGGGGGGGGGRSAGAASQRQQDGPRASAFSRLGLPVDGNAPDRKRSDRGAGAGSAPQRQEPVSLRCSAAPLSRMCSTARDSEPDTVLFTYTAYADHALRMLAFKPIRASGLSWPKCLGCSDHAGKDSSGNILLVEQAPVSPSAAASAPRRRGADERPRGGGRGGVGAPARERRQPPPAAEPSHHHTIAKRLFTAEVELASAQPVWRCSVSQLGNNFCNPATRLSCSNKT